jgi:hypothetical protein|tara:strand:- start:1348 stop:1845 length:498 start_codon:yes stop_codon:yes gene_type:complete
MSQPDILFQYNTTTANTNTSEAELAFQAEQYGVTMITSIFPTPSAGGTVTYRVHHCGEAEEPHAANCILYARARDTNAISESARSVKIILNPGDRIFCQLHDGSGVTITAYGLRPQQPTVTDALPREARETVEDPQTPATMVPQEGFQAARNFSPRVMGKPGTGY